MNSYDSESFSEQSSTLLMGFLFVSLHSIKVFNLFDSICFNKVSF